MEVISIKLTDYIIGWLVYRIVIIDFVGQKTRFKTCQAEKVMKRRIQSETKLIDLFLCIVLIGDTYLYIIYAISSRVARPNTLYGNSIVHY